MTCGCAYWHGLISAPFRKLCFTIVGMEGTKAGRRIKRLFLTFGKKRRLGSSLQRDEWRIIRHSKETGDYKTNFRQSLFMSCCRTSGSPLNAVSKLTPCFILEVVRQPNSFLTYKSHREGKPPNLSLSIIKSSALAKQNQNESRQPHQSEI